MVSPYIHQYLRSRHLCWSVSMADRQGFQKKGDQSDHRLVAQLGERDPVVAGEG